MQLWLLLLIKDSIVYPKSSK